METKTKNYIVAYEVCYVGNSNRPLMSTPVFTERAGAEKYARDTDGCGLKYESFVKARRVTIEDVKRYDRIRKWTLASGYRINPEPEHIKRARRELAHDD